MSDYETNVYYHPEKHGLTVVAEIDWSSGSYEFDTRVVWKHKDGRLFTGRDSGCSCPTPFESVASIEGLERLDVRALEAEAEKELVPKYEDAPVYRTALEVRAFLDAVRAAAEESR